MLLDSALSASRPRDTAVLTLPLDSPRLVLRRLAMTDTDAFTAYRADPLVARYQDWEHVSRSEAATFIRRQRRQVPGVPNRWTQIALALRESDTLIGDCGVFVHPDAQQATVGITLARAFQGQGYATEALTALFDQLFRDASLHRIAAEVDPRNRPSWRLLERLGMRREGHRRQSTWFKGQWADDYLYALLQEEWQAQRPSRSST